MAAGPYQTHVHLAILRRFIDPSSRPVGDPGYPGLFMVPGLHVAMHREISGVRRR